MRKLERDELIPALKDRDSGDLQSYEYAQLAEALKEELDVTLLRSQQSQQIQLLLNYSTRERMRQQRALETGSDNTPIRPIDPEETSPLALPESELHGPQEHLPVTVPDQIDAEVPERPETDIVMTTPAATPSSSPSETPAASAA